MSDPFVNCRDLTVKVGRKVLLDKVSFQLNASEHHVILGPNGAGKSTLVRALLGLIKVDSGEVRYSGRVGQKRAELAKRVAYVPQLLAAEIPYTVREFVAMGRYAHEGCGESAVENAMQSVGVTAFADRVVSTLSGGERQRVCIAAALAQQADLIILDEPLVHLDPRQRREIQALLKELMAEVTVLVVTHDLVWAQRDFDHLIVMEESRLTYQGAVNAFYTDGGIERLFGEGVLPLGKEVSDVG